MKDAAWPKLGGQSVCGAPSRNNQPLRERATLPHMDVKSSPVLHARNWDAGSNTAVVLYRTVPLGLFHLTISHMYMWRRL